MKKLTKAEEEIMLILWRLKEALVRDIIAELDNPETPYTTVSTIIRILEKKNFVSHKAYGNTHLYFPLISKKEYSRLQIKEFVSNYFNGSFSTMAAFFAKENNISLQELRELLSELERERDKKLKNE